jgi:ABC-type multidrug transport system fused ATPase/permease subunit
MPHPLRRLLVHARAYRKDIALATVFSVANKFFDVLPEVLIGVAVDVVANRKASFLARAGIIDPKNQLFLLAAMTVVIWVFESLFEYLYAIRWRNLAQDLQHDLRMEAYRHVQRLELAWFERRRTGSLMSVLNDDINQLERFLNGGANDLIQVITGSLLVGVVFFALTSKIAVLALIPIPLIVYGASASRPSRPTQPRTTKRGTSKKGPTPIARRTRKRSGFLPPSRPSFDSRCSGDSPSPSFTGACSRSGVKSASGATPFSSISRSDSSGQ